MVYHFIFRGAGALRPGGRGPTSREFNYAPPCGAAETVRHTFHGWRKGHLSHLSHPFHPAAIAAGFVAPALAVVAHGSLVYWTTVSKWQWEEGDDGQCQRATHIVYDAVGAWPETKLWHCLDDVTWHAFGEDE